MHMLKMLFGVGIMGLAMQSYAMRCGTHLINSGDSVTRMLQLCGTPTQDTYSNIIYLNKDGDGMNYYIHVSGAGIIDSIYGSRGGLR